MAVLAKTLERLKKNSNRITNLELVEKHWVRSDNFDQNFDLLIKGLPALTNLQSLQIYTPDTEEGNGDYVVLDLEKICRLLSAVKNNKSLNTIYLDFNEEIFNSAKDKEFEEFCVLLEQYPKKLELDFSVVNFSELSQNRSVRLFLALGRYPHLKLFNLVDNQINKFDTSVFTAFVNFLRVTTCSKIYLNATFLDKLTIPQSVDFAAALKQNHSIQDLSIAYCNLSDNPEVFSNITAALIEHPSIRILDIAGNKISHLKNALTLKKKNNTMVVSALKNIAHLIEHGPLTTLYLTENSLDEAWLTLGPALQKSSKLEVLSLSSNPIGEMVSERVKSTPAFHALITGIQNNQSLTTLQLDGCMLEHLSKNLSQQLTDALRLNTSITALSLQSNDLGQAPLGGKLLNLCKKPNLFKLRVRDNDLIDVDKLLIREAMVSNYRKMQIKAAKALAAPKKGINGTVLLLPLSLGAYILEFIFDKKKINFSFLSRYFINTLNLKPQNVLATPSNHGSKKSKKRKVKSNHSSSAHNHSAEDQIMHDSLATLQSSSLSSNTSQSMMSNEEAFTPFSPLYALMNLAAGTQRLPVPPNQLSIKP